MINFCILASNLLKKASVSKAAVAVWPIAVLPFWRAWVICMIAPFSLPINCVKFVIALAPLPRLVAKSPTAPCSGAKGLTTVNPFAPAIREFRICTTAPPRDFSINCIPVVKSILDSLSPVAINPAAELIGFKSSSLPISWTLKLFICSAISPIGVVSVSNNLTFSISSVPKVLKCFVSACIAFSIASAGT